MEDIDPKEVRENARRQRAEREAGETVKISLEAETGNAIFNAGVYDGYRLAIRDLISLALCAVIWVIFIHEFWFRHD